ncbi:MAG: FG-GAP repeat protein [Thermoanaerobaculia bacterium]|nr:FG-GAP repeat protein [Thermoanaerobaculia bacterium]
MRYRLDLSRRTNNRCVRRLLCQDSVLAAMGRTFVPLVSLAILIAAGSAFAVGPEDLLTATPRVLAASNPSSLGNQAIGFGAAVALDGTLLVVGAPNEDKSTDTSVSQVGAVYVFERQGFDWVEIQKLRADEELAFEQFGFSVAVARGFDGDGPLDYIVVGAPGYQNSSGRAYLFHRRTGEGFVLEGSFSQENPDAGDLFGQSVAMDFFYPPNTQSGNYQFFFAVGAPFDRDPDDVGNQQHGSVQVFQRTGGPPTWGPSPLPFFGEPNDNLGGALAMSEFNILAAGENIEDPSQGLLFGGGLLITQVNQLPGGDFNYEPVWELIPSAAAGFAGIGASAAVQAGTIAALGAPLDDEVAFNAGKVYIFDISGGIGPVLTEAEILTPVELVSGSQFGTSVALSGNLLAASAPGASADGMIFLFEQGEIPGDWTQIGFIEPPPINPPFTCIEGASITLQGLTAGVGCPSRGSVADGGTFAYFVGGLFFDGFETGDTTVWSSSQP